MIYRVHLQVHLSYNDQFVFVSSIKVIDEKSGKGELLALCLNRDSGKLLWKNNAGSGYRPGNNDGFDYQLDSRSTMQVHPL